MSSRFEGVVKLEPGDRLLIVTPERLTMARAEEIRQEFRKFLEIDGDPISVLGGRDLGVIIIPADYSMYSIAEKKENDRIWTHVCIDGITSCLNVDVACVNCGLHYKKDDTWSHYCDKTNSVVILHNSNLSCLACEAYPGESQPRTVWTHMCVGQEVVELPLFQKSCDRCTSRY